MSVSMIRTIYQCCIVVVICRANETANIESSSDDLSSWLRERVDGVSHSLKDLLPKRIDTAPSSDNGSSSLNSSIQSPFWDPSEWHLWNATNGLLKKGASEIADEDGEAGTDSTERVGSLSDSVKGAFRQYLERLANIRGRWKKPPENATEAKDDVADPSGVRINNDDSVIGDTNGDGIVDVSVPPEYDSRGLLPAEDILESLKCRPTISFTSCFNHCLSLIVPSKGEKGYSLTQALMYPQKPTLENKRLLTESEGNSTSGRGNKKIPSKYAPDESPRSFDLWELVQLKNCVVSVCTHDYIKRPLPGCLDGNGDIVRLSPDQIKPVIGDKETPLADDYEKLDFYDPGRLEFWHGMGFFTIQRIWFEIVHGKGLIRLVLLPCAVMILLSLPMFLLALIVPGMAPLIPGEDSQDPRPPASRSRSVASRPAMTLQAVDIDDYGEIIHPSGIRFCDATFANSKLLSYLKVIVDGLTLISSQLFETAQAAFVHGSGLFHARDSFFNPTGESQSAPGLVEMMDRSHMKYSPLPSSELIPAEEEAERGKRCPPGTVTTLPSTGNTLPSPTHDDRMYFHRFE